MLLNIPLHLDQMVGGRLGRLTPFVGGGIGRVGLKADDLGSFPNGLLLTDDRTDAAAYHVSAGLAVAFNDKTNIELGARRETFTGIEFTDVGGSIVENDVDRTSFTVGFCLRTIRAPRRCMTAMEDGSGFVLRLPDGDGSLSREGM